MKLSLKVVSSDTEFPELVRCERRSYETPYNGLYALFCPIIGKHETARAEALEETAERAREWHTSDPSSHWLKVVDEDEGGKVVGGARWLLYEESPYAKPPEEEMTCYWWPEGPKREMADQAMDQFMGPRLARMNKPHALLEICFAEPSYRRHGVGSLLMQWGTQKADEKGLESFVEASIIGKPFCEKHGFAHTNDFELNVTPPERTDELVLLQQDLHFEGRFMWRPVGGKFVKGETAVPWSTQT